jgi:hypothetical protein
VKAPRGRHQARQTSGGRAHLNLGLAFRQRGYLAEALAGVPARAGCGEDRDAVLQGSRKCTCSDGIFAPALELYGNLLERQPGNAGSGTTRASVLHHRARGTSPAAYTQATQLDPSYALAWNNLGAIRPMKPTTRRDRALQAALRARPTLPAPG